MTFNSEKATEAVIYIAKHTQSPSFHSISKLLWFAEKHHLQHWGRMIVGDSFVAMEYGPVPSNVYDFLQRVHAFGYDEDGYGLVINSPRDIRTTREPDLKVFSKSDIASLDHVIDKYGNLSFGDLTNISHDKAYQDTEQNKQISLDSIINTLPNTDDLKKHLAT